MPEDEAQQAPVPDDKPAVRRTAMQVAEATERQVAEFVADVTADLERHDEKLTDLDGRVRELHEAGSSAGPDVAWGDEIAQIRKGFEEFREEVGGYQGAVNRKLDAHTTRLAKVEKASEPGVPADGAVPQSKLDGILARLELAERKVAEFEAHKHGERAEVGMTPEQTEQFGASLRAYVDEKLAVLTKAASLSDRLSAAAAPTRPARPFAARRKVLRLMQLVDSIGKDRQTDSGPRYRYRSIDDAMDAVGHAMREVGLVLETRILDRQVAHNIARNSEGRELLWTTVQLTTGYTFVDPDDNSEHSFEMAGEGRASDDKATSKATAMALKYGLLHALMIPVSGMPDGDAESPQVVSTPPAAPQQSSAPADGGQQANQPQGQPDRMARARAAKQALDRLHLVPAAERYQRFVSIGNLANQEGLLNIEVEGATVRAWLGAAEQTLQQQEPPPDNGAF
jgi:hypothetical protein